MKHVIISSTDEKYADFLLNHWLASLRDHVDLTNIDVVVIDYGMGEDHRRQLQSLGVRCHPSVLDGNITNIRYRDIADVLNERTYDQVLSVDGGDLIFQADISHLFEQHRNRFRAVCDQVHVPFHEAILPRKDIRPDDFERMFWFLKGKPRINGGVIFGPADQFKELWKGYLELTQGYQVFGTDQFVMNYMLHQRGFVALPNKYNYVILTKKSRFWIRNGIFIDRNREPIPVVHNTGWKTLTRCIGNFGYGKDRNRFKVITYYGLRIFFACTNFINRLRGYYEPTTSNP